MEVNWSNTVETGLSLEAKNSHLSFSDTGDDKEEAPEHHNTHDHPKHHQPHLHRLLHERGERCWDTFEFQRPVIQLEGIVDSSST